MKYTLTLLITIYSIIASFSQELDCKSFKNGTFYYPGLDGKISIRNDSIQKSLNNDALEMIWKVKWVNDCEYNLTCNEILIKNSPIKLGDRINVKITETDNKCYNSSLIIFNKDNPNGINIPSGPLCKLQLTKN